MKSHPAKHCTPSSVSNDTDYQRYFKDIIDTGYYPLCHDNNDDMIIENLKSHTTYKLISFVIDKCTELNK